MESLSRYKKKNRSKRVSSLCAFERERVTSTMTSTDSADSDYWGEIDRISNQYREAAQHEERYIYENTVDIKNSAYKIVTGFSSARGYVPAVRILMNVQPVYTKPDNISFIREDWDDFITYLQQFLTDYFDNANATDAELTEEEEIQFSDYSIIKSPFIGNKMLKVTNGFSTFYFSGVTIQHLIDVNKLISSHLDLLYDVHFDYFYNHFLNVTNNIVSESNYELSPYNIMLSLCDLYPGNIQLQCMRECLTYNGNNVLNDLDRKMFLLNT